MSLEKILNKIIEDAQTEADNILRESREKASEIKEEIREEASRLSELILKEGEKQGRLEAGKIVTQARLEKRIELLSIKKGFIEEVLEKAFEGIDSGKRSLSRTVILKDGEREESFDEKHLKAELRPKLENYIAEILKI